MCTEILKHFVNSERRLHVKSGSVLTDQTEELKTLELLPSKPSAKRQTRLQKILSFSVYVFHIRNVLEKA